MQALVIVWTKEKAKMAKIIRHISMFIANNSIFKSIMQFFSQINSTEWVMNFEKNSFYRF